MRGAGCTTRSGLQWTGLQAPGPHVGERVANPAPCGSPSRSSHHPRRPASGLLEPRPPLPPPRSMVILMVHYMFLKNWVVVEGAGVHPDGACLNVEQFSGQFTQGTTVHRATETFLSPCTCLISYTLAPPPRIPLTETAACTIVVKKKIVLIIRTPTEEDYQKLEGRTVVRERGPKKDVLNSKNEV